MPEYSLGLCWSADGGQLCATAKDKFIRVYDPRQSEAVVAVMGFDGTKSQKAVFLDNHQRILVTGFTKLASRAVAIYDPRNMESKLEEKELDQAAGVLLPFYDEDTSMVYISGKGDGVIRYYEYENGELQDLAEFRSSVPHKGLCFAPKSAVDFMTCEVAFCLRLQKTIIEPIHFTVPRKSGEFQDDLFPITYAGKPACTAAEWLGGETRMPEKCPIQDAAQGSAASEFVAKKSAAELEKELAEALERIAELEAEVASLRGN